MFELKKYVIHNDIVDNDHNDHHEQNKFLKKQIDTVGKVHTAAIR